MGEFDQHQSTRQIHDLSEAISTGQLQPVKRLVNSLSAAEIGGLLESLPPSRRMIVWKLVDSDYGGEVLVHVNDEVRGGLIDVMENHELVAATGNLQLDDLADILDDLPDTVIRQVLHSMDHDDRERLSQVLAYPEDSAGGLMSPDVVTVRANVTLDVVSRYLRQRGHLPELTDYLYVVNRTGQYLGRLAITDLLTKEPRCQVSDLIDASVSGIPLDLSANEVALKFEHHDWVSAPVVDANNRLVGRITIDDVVDVIRDEAEHSVMSMAGLDEETDMFAPVARSVRRRMIWLSFNLIAALLAAWAISQFEGTIQQVVALAALMPIVASMGGIAGSQTLTLMIRGMALGQIGGRNSWPLLSRELAVGFINGLTLSIIVGGLAAAWFDQLDIGLVIGSALVINLLVGALAGVLIPLILNRLDIDPALAGGVVLISITDVVGFVTFLGLGTIYLL
ncbi:MAG: magnesium transporter MgtE [Lysobacteraceae bacterium]|nr:MAG: magnesium transporter MgtE [Xanthomonadaceae bacterium]